MDFKKKILNFTVNCPYCKVLHLICNGNVFFFFFFFFFFFLGGGGGGGGGPRKDLNLDNCILVWKPTGSNSEASKGDDVNTIYPRDKM